MLGFTIRKLVELFIINFLTLFNYLYPYFLIFLINVACLVGFMFAKNDINIFVNSYFFISDLENNNRKCYLF